MALDMKPITTALHGLAPTFPVTIEDCQVLYDALKPHVPDPYILDVQWFAKGICVRIYQHGGCELQRLFARDLFAVDG